MESQTVALLIVIVVLLLAFTITVIWSIRRGRKWAEARDAERLAAAEAHRIELHQSAAEHQNRETALKARNKATAELRARAVRAAAQGMKWELASRHQLVKACKRAELDAVVATNIVFTPDESADHAFCAQIDHLVVTSHLVLVVESKCWNGVVFDGVRPSSHAAAFSTLFDEKDMIAPFAVQVTQPDEGTPLLTWRTHTGKDAPARQARKQAVRLRELLKERSETVPYIDTCVFYSHHKSKVIARPFDQERNARTLIATSENLHRVIKEAHRAKKQAVDNAHAALVIETARELGADLVGTGRLAERYRSPVRLGFRFTHDDDATA